MLPATPSSVPKAPTVFSARRPPASVRPNQPATRQRPGSSLSGSSFALPVRKNDGRVGAPTHMYLLPDRKPRYLRPGQAQSHHLFAAGDAQSVGASLEAYVDHAG